MKNVFLFTASLFVSIILLGCSQTQDQTDQVVTLNNEIDSLSYFLGIDVGENIKNGVDTVNIDIFASGLKSTFNGGDLVVDKALTRAYIENYFKKEFEKKNAEKMKENQVTFSKNIEEGDKFLAENATKEGVVTLASGLQYKVLKAGNGPKPSQTDIVTTHYHGTLINGTVFDSSVDRGEPAQFPVNRVIPGWTEALQLMNVGSKWQLFIPYNLAYADQGNGAIEPFSTLIFDVELISIDTPAR